VESYLKHMGIDERLDYNLPYSITVKKQEINNRLTVPDKRINFYPEEEYEVRIIYSNLRTLGWNIDRIEDFFNFWYGIKKLKFDKSLFRYVENGNGRGYLFYDHKKIFTISEEDYDEAAEFCLQLKLNKWSWAQIQEEGVQRFGIRKLRCKDKIPYCLKRKIIEPSADEGRLKIENKKKSNQTEKRRINNKCIIKPEVSCDTIMSYLLQIEVNAYKMKGQDDKRKMIISTVELLKRYLKDCRDGKLIVKM